MHNTLISVSQLRFLIDSASPVVIVDSRFDLSDSTLGRTAYLSAHIPGAQHADLAQDLSNMAGAAELGRHPLPNPDALAGCCARWGLNRSDQIVCYDQGSGLFAARLWWLLRATGFAAVAVLDGGLDEWMHQGGATSKVEYQPTSAKQIATSGWRWPTVDTPTVERARKDGSRLLLDARAANRFRGDIEPIDPVAGHVPGAINRPFTENLVEGKFKSAALLALEFRDLLGEIAPARVIHMCGSGVTACHNILAMEIAGLHGSALYGPSFSGYIASADRADMVKAWMARAK